MSTSSRDLKWFMREIKSICIRNLSGSETLKSSPSVHIQLVADSKSPSPKVLFKSSIAEQTCNPSWTTSSLISPDLTQTLSCIDRTEITVEVYNGSNIIQSFDIDFRKLFRAGKINLLTPELTSLPINTIIFLSENSFLVTDVVFNHAKASPSLKFLYTQISTAKQTEQDAVDFDKMDLKLTSARDKFKKISDVIARKKMELEQAHIAAIKTRKLIDNQAKKDELLKLKAALVQADAEAVAVEKLEMKEWESLRALRDFSTDMDICANHIDNIQMQNEAILAQKNDLMKLQFMFEARQIRLISELQEIYPIERSSNGEYTIRGLELNELAAQQRDDEVPASALGCLVHMLILLSKYLECPLRYTLVFLGSRSQIRDPLGGPPSNLHGVTLPLYRRGEERDRYNLALYWLRCDVEQILNCRRTTYDLRLPLLANMFNFFNH